MSRVADDLYLIAHDERSGRARVAEPVVALGLAAALVGELVLSGHLTVRGDGVYPLVSQPPVDGLLQEVLEPIRDPRQDRDLTMWLSFVAVEAVTDVRERLVRGGTLAPVRARRLTGARRVRHVPAVLNASAWPAVRLARTLSHGEPMPMPDALLTCLVAVTGLLGNVLWFPEDHAPGWRAATLLRKALPDPFAVLVAHTEVAVGDNVLTRRGV